jgi:hypothetical protein
MSDWTIEIAQLPIVETAGSHTFWVLKDPSGNTVREIQGFATRTDGTAKTAGGPFTPNDTIGIHDLSRTDLYRADISTALPSGYFMSEWNGADITSTTAFSGTEAEVMARWGKVGPTAEILNRLGVDYGPLTIGNNYNSNSVARYAGELMGLEDAQPPNLVSGNPANAVGWNKELMDRIVDGMIFQIESEEARLGRQLTDVELLPYVEAIQTVADAHEECFGPEVPIDMWPLDPSFKPGPDGLFDQEEVRSKIWRKPIELIRAGDLVVSFDGDGNLVPGPVSRTMTNDVKILLDFFGTRVTPGHVYYRPDSKKSHKFETLIDILRDDGYIENTKGEHLRANTGLPVGGVFDACVQAVLGDVQSDGEFKIRAVKDIRLGSRVVLEDGRDFCIADIIKAGGGVVLENGLIATDACPEGMPFHWTISDRLPNPEDYILRRSNVSLADIYTAGEWEDMQPRLPAPTSSRSAEDETRKGVSFSPRSPLN